MSVVKRMTEKNIVDLTEEDFLMSPDCHICREPTKRPVGKTFDVEGPGRVGVLYDCDNLRCKTLKDRKCSYFLAFSRQ